MAAVFSSITRLDKLKAQPRKAGEASFFFYDAHFRNDAVKILPGEYFVQLDAPFALPGELRQTTDQSLQAATQQLRTGRGGASTPGSPGAAATPVQGPTVGYALATDSLFPAGDVFSAALTWLCGGALVAGYLTSATLGLIGLHRRNLLRHGVVLFLINVLKSLYRGVRAPQNPWGAETLEWATESPPPVYNFLRLPVVASRSPLWEEKDLPVVTGLALDRREVLVTAALDAEPSHREEIPGPSPWPLVTSITTSIGLIGSVFNVWWLPAGFVASIPPAVAWYFTQEKP